MADDRLGQPQLVQAGTDKQEFDELEGLRAFGKRPVDPSPSGPTEEGEAPGTAGSTAGTEAPALRLTRNPSPGDGFDELDGLKSFSQDWQALVGSTDRNQEAAPGVEESAAADGDQPTAVPEATPQSNPQAAEDSEPVDSVPELRFDETTAVRQGIDVQELPLLSEEAGRSESASADPKGEETPKTDAPQLAAPQPGSPQPEAPEPPEPSSALLEQEIGKLFDPQPLEDEELVLGALPEPGAEAQSETELPANTSSVPAEEQAQILSKLEELDPVVATVGEENIHWTDVTNVAKRLPERYQGRLETVFPILLQRIVDLKLLALAGRRLGLDQAEDLRARVAAYEERLVSQAFLHRHLSREVTPEALKKRHDEVVQESAARTRIRARHILLKTEADARQVIEDLDQGADFVELAKTRSIGASAANGGSLGRFSVDRMVPAFSAAALALSPGQYTREPVFTQFGWHVILLEEGAVQQSLDYAGLEQGLRQEVSEAVIERLLRDLRVDAQIEFFPDPDLGSSSSPGTAAVAPVEDEAATPE